MDIRERKHVHMLIRGHADEGGHTGALQRPSRFSGHPAFHSGVQYETVQSIYFAVFQAQQVSVCGRNVNTSNDEPSPYSL